MKRTYIIIIIIGLSGCQTKVVNLNGHYISISKLKNDTYETLDINDSLVLINKDNVFITQRDTIVIDTETNSFISSTRVMFPIYDFKVVNDTIELHFQHDAGQEKVKFIKGAKKSPKDYFSTSYIDIDLLDYQNEELINTNDLEILNLIIGPVKKGIDWLTNDKDSIYIEFENEFFLQKNEIKSLADKLIQGNDKKVILCLNYDKRVTQSMKGEIKNELIKIIGNLEMTESRDKDNEIVYLK